MDTMAASSDYDPNTKKCSCNIGTMCRHLDLEWRPDRKPVDEVLECRGTAKDDSLTIGETLILLTIRVRSVERELEERHQEKCGKLSLRLGAKIVWTSLVAFGFNGVDCPRRPPHKPFFSMTALKDIR